MTCCTPLHARAAAGWNIKMHTTGREWQWGSVGNRTRGRVKCVCWRRNQRVARTTTPRAHPAPRRRLPRVAPSQRGILRASTAHTARCTRRAPAHRARGRTPREEPRMATPSAAAATVTFSAGQSMTADQLPPELRAKCVEGRGWTRRRGAKGRLRGAAAAAPGSASQCAAAPRRRKRRRHRVASAAPRPRPTLTAGWLGGLPVATSAGAGAVPRRQPPATPL